MRSVLARPFSLIPASRMLEFPYQARRELGADFVNRFLDSKVARLRHRETGIAAWIDRRKRREIHVDVQRETVISPAAGHADAERRDLRAAHVDARRSRLAFATAAEKLDRRVFEHRNELLHLDAAPR